VLAAPQAPARRSRTRQPRPYGPGPEGPGCGPRDPRAHIGHRPTRHLQEAPGPQARADDRRHGTGGAGRPGHGTPSGAHHVVGGPRRHPCGGITARSLPKAVRTQQSCARVSTDHHRNRNAPGHRGRLGPHRLCDGATPVPSRPSEPRPEGTGETQIVQAPAREALELIGPPRDSTPSVSTAPEPAAPTLSAAAPTPAVPPPAPPPRKKHRGSPPQRYGPPPESRPHVDIPPLPKDLPTRPPKNSDVCALGHKYGGWGRDTPQAAICKDVYGR
jgi:hypothetical protein